MGVFGAISYLPLYLQGVIGLTASRAGMVLLFVSVAWTAGSLIAGQVLNRFGYRAVALPACLFCRSATACSCFSIIRSEHRRSWRLSGSSDRHRHGHGESHDVSCGAKLRAAPTDRRSDFDAHAVSNFRRRFRRERDGHRDAAVKCSAGLSQLCAPAIFPPRLLGQARQSAKSPGACNPRADSRGTFAAH